MSVVFSGCGEVRSRAYSDTFFRSQSECTSHSFGQVERHSPTGETSLATAHVMVTPSRSPTDDSSSSGGGLLRGAGGDAVALSSSLLTNGTCDDTSSLLSSLSAAIARSSTHGSLPTMTVYPSATTHSTPTFEDIPFEEPNLDSIAIRAPYVSRNIAYDTLGNTALDGMNFGADELSSVDLSNEDFNSMFEQVIAQSRPSAGRAVLGTTSSDSYVHHYSASSPMVSGACAPVPSRSSASPPLKRPVINSVYEDNELKPLSMGAGVYCGSTLYWPAETMWSDQQRAFQQQYGASVTRQV
ncbi:hypothetical protein OESDEN_11947 [Oesophagostomum dentatum]|uniref:Uncharacterized protein n=1 Tax=Oesophagostomum dentatum TaxID=61180 RepID=A0A0B1SWI2_OESDE|nr:hypothetical protein OESDEN_11947 [Oesophagostomum dentatum]